MILLGYNLVYIRLGCSTTTAGAAARVCVGGGGGFRCLPPPTHRDTHWPPQKNLVPALCKWHLNTPPAWMVCGKEFPTLCYPGMRV